MLLTGNFYSIQSFTTTPGSVEAVIAINPSHNIFEGHFPGQPVVPGVCMVQIVKELLEKTIERETRLINADNIKFLSVINPVEDNIATINLRYVVPSPEVMELTATIQNHNATCFKMKGIFKPVL